jgi:hypothetical protein
MQIKFRISLPVIAVAILSVSVSAERASSALDASVVADEVITKSKAQHKGSIRGAIDMFFSLPSKYNLSGTSTLDVEAVRFSMPRSEAEDVHTDTNTVPTNPVSEATRKTTVRHLASSSSHHRATDYTDDDYEGDIGDRTSERRLPEYGSKSPGKKCITGKGGKAGGKGGKSVGKGGKSGKGSSNSNKTHRHLKDKGKGGYDQSYYVSGKGEGKGGYGESYYVSGKGKGKGGYSKKYKSSKGYEGKGSKGSKMSKGNSKKGYSKGGYEGKGKGGYEGKGKGGYEGKGKGGYEGKGKGGYGKGKGKSRRQGHPSTRPIEAQRPFHLSDLFT